MLNKFVADFLAGGVKTLETNLMKLRSTLKVAADEASGSKLAELGLKIAETQSKLGVYMNLDRAPTMLPNSKTPHRDILDTLYANLNLDDEWSGRGNDVRRAVFTAQLEAMKECRAVICDN